VRQTGDFIIVEVCANGFLYRMVRNLVGSLILVGKGQRPVDWMAQLLAGRDRRLSGPTAPPSGLYFLGPEYPAEFGLPAVPRDEGLW